MRVLFLVGIMFFSSMAFAQTDYNLLERIELLLPGNEQRLKQYHTELYNLREQNALELLTPVYQAWLNYKKTGSDLYLYRSVLLADQLTSNLRYMAFNKNHGDTEELVTIATIAYYEFYSEFEQFTQKSWVSAYYKKFDVANFKTVVYDFKNIYFSELEQPVK